jgi:hypothetical protein
VNQESTAPRLFSLDEANALIPRLEFIMERIQRCSIALRTALEELARERDEPVGDVAVRDLLARHPALRAVVDDLEQLIDAVGEVGGQFQGLELGLVDFASEIDGQIGLLCWQYGEKEITHWHTLTGGFAGRRPLPRNRRSSYLQ